MSITFLLQFMQDHGMRAISVSCDSAAQIELDPVLLSALEGKNE
jgi:hypothetical protein